MRHRYPASIVEVEIDRRSAWQRKHLRALQLSYARAPHRDVYLPLIEAALGNGHTHLAPLNIDLIHTIAEDLGLDTPIFLSSTIDTDSGRTGRLVGLCLALEADVYLAGAGGRQYMDVAAFEAVGIEVRFQEYGHPVYPQCFGGFEPHLSIVDLLLNCGRESLSVLRSTGVAAHPGIPAASERSSARPVAGQPTRSVR